MSRITKLENTGDSYFYSLCHTSKKKKRTCLKCRIVFVSDGAGHRTCCNCLAVNGRAPARALHPYSGA